jgi:large subunit ribosomal protein L19
MQSKFLQAVEDKQTKSDVPDFKVGDTVVVHQKLLDGQKERIQTFEGDVIARNGGGLKEMMVVRKIVQGEGVERIFLIHSPRIARIEIKKAGAVRRAKLYYIRDRVGKAVRIKPDAKRQAALEAANTKAAAEAAAVKAAAAKEQQAAEGGVSKRAAKRKAKADAAAKK